MSAKNISTLITQIFADQYSEAHQNLETILQEKVKAKVKETLKKIKGKDKDKKKDDKKDGKKKFDPKTFFKKTIKENVEMVPSIEQIDQDSWSIADFIHKVGVNFAFFIADDQGISRHELNPGEEASTITDLVFRGLIKNNEAAEAHDMLVRYYQMYLQKTKSSK